MRARESESVPVQFARWTNVLPVLDVASLRSTSNKAVEDVRHAEGERSPIGRWMTVQALVTAERPRCRKCQDS